MVRNPLEMFADSRISGSGLPEELQASIALSRRLKNILLRSVVLMEIFSGKRIS